MRALELKKREIKVKRKLKSGVILKSETEIISQKMTNLKNI